MNSVASRKFKVISDLTQFTKNSFEIFLRSFDTVLHDFNGVLTHGNTIIPDAGKSVKLLQKLGKVTKVITNNSIHNKDSWNEKMSHLNLTFDDVIFPIKAVAAYLKETNFQKKVLLFGFDSLSDYLENEGIQIYKLKQRPHLSKFMEVFPYLSDDQDIGAVIVDADVNRTMLDYNNALFSLQRPDVKLIFCATDKFGYFNKIKFIGPHFLQTSLEEISGKKALIFGKPNQLYGEFVKKHVNLIPERTLFVGDSLDSDMKFAYNCGFKKCLVFSGVTARNELKHVHHTILPDYCLPSYGDLYKTYKHHFPNEICI